MKGFLGKEPFVWFIGEVVSLDDETEIGRVKVRCFGYHSETLTADQLPYAIVGTPTTSASLNGIGTSPTGIEKGSWVVGFFIDGNDCQQPLIILTIPAPQDVIDRSVGRSQSTKNYRTQGVSDPYAAEYPNNKVIKTKSGHIVELDDTAGAERINIQHKSGASIEIHPDGKIVAQAASDAVIEGSGRLLITVEGEAILASSFARIDSDLRIEGNVFLSGDVITDAGITLLDHRHKILTGSSKGVTDKSSK